MKIISTLILTLSLSALCHAQGGTWTFMKGSYGMNAPAVVGTKGVPDPANYPNGRIAAYNWTDTAGNFWILGGWDGSGHYGDMWRYEPARNMWTYMNGSLVLNALGVYGIQGVPSAANYPGARLDGTTWTDLNGHLWLFGGRYKDRNAFDNLCNDLWMYDIPTNQWTWVNGPDTSGSSCHYGTRGVASASNRPAVRALSNTSWVKSDNTLWLFGGAGLNGALNDLWKYDISTNMWTWMNGDSGVNAPGNYGVMGVEAASNVPPCSSRAYSHWQDPDDNFYLYDGLAANTAREESVVWRYNSNNNRWTWVSGNIAPGDSGLYTQYCQPGQNARPRSRSWMSTTCTNACQNAFWTFGGFSIPDFGYPSTFNDLWNYNYQTNQWTWVSGPDTMNSTGDYGNMGVPAPGNMPPARGSSCMWSDRTGAVYVFGGFTYIPNMLNYDVFSDMWRFEPDTGCAHAASILLPLKVMYTDTDLCYGDSAHISVAGGYIASVSPQTGVQPIDSQHVSLRPSVNTQYTVIVIGTCGQTDTLHYSLMGAQSSVGGFEKTVCTGTQVSFGGHVYSTSGSYRDTLTNVRGCDSIVTMTLHVIPYYNTALRDTICSGSSYLFHGRALRLSGTYIDTLPSLIRCDSIITLSLYVTPPPVGHLSASICGNATYKFGGRDLSAPGTYYDTMMRASGCDSVTILALTVRQLSATTISHIMCAGDSVLLGSRTVYTSGSYTDTVTAANGCDSIVTLTVTVYPRPIAGLSITPAGDTVPMGLISVASSSRYTDSIYWLLNDQLAVLQQNNALPISDTGSFCIRLVAVSDGGCSDTTQQCIYVFENAFVMPNAFTPNGDGKNDLFYPVFITRDSSAVESFTIYNRWGQLLYNDPARGWDGKYQEQLQPQGDYNYFITVNLPARGAVGERRTVSKEGKLTLIR